MLCLITESKFDFVTVFLNPQESCPGLNSYHCKLGAQRLWGLSGSGASPEGRHIYTRPTQWPYLQPNSLRLSTTQCWVYEPSEVWALRSSDQAFDVIMSYLETKHTGNGLRRPSSSPCAIQYQRGLLQSTMVDTDTGLWWRWRASSTQYCLLSRHPRPAPPHARLQASGPAGSRRLQPRSWRPATPEAGWGKRESGAHRAPVCEPANHSLRRRGGWAFHQ